MWRSPLIRTRTTSETLFIFIVMTTFQFLLKVDASVEALLSTSCRWYYSAARLLCYHGNNRLQQVHVSMFTVTLVGVSMLELPGMLSLRGSCSAEPGTNREYHG